VLNRVDQDVGFWRQLAQQSGGPVLELACGTGRLCVPIARAGVEIVGIDNDPVMLAAALRRSRDRSMSGTGSPRLVAADMRRFAFTERFPLIFVGYNSLQLLPSPAAMADCLDHARRHLSPGGLLGVEVTDFQLGPTDGPDSPVGPDSPDSPDSPDRPESPDRPDGPEGPGAGKRFAPCEDDSFVPLADAEGIRLSGSLVHHMPGRTSRYRRLFEGDGWVIEDEVVVGSLNRGELEAILRRARLDPVRWWVDGATIRALAAHVA
jgi:SAM-dependent methyltransferase